MSDKPRIPSWQRTSPDSSPSSPAAAELQPIPAPQPEQGSTPAVEEPTPTESDFEEPKSVGLLEQASRFLDDPKIRGAPRETKVAFLESKGVASDDISALLGAETQDNDTVDLEAAGERAWSIAPPQPTEPSHTTPKSRDIPPIVTYPEFLAQTEKSPPLITTQRLLATAYVTGGLMATLYGFSKYIIAPMTQNLTESRHDFAAHAHEQLEEFNKRLGQVVSIDPACKTQSKTMDIVDDISEADSDPTELYHRDYGTQTTPNLSRRPSVSSGIDPESTVTVHENRLRAIKLHLEELESTRTNGNASADSLKTKVTDLTTYLSEMSYQNQYYSNMGGLYSANYSSLAAKDGKNDQIEVLKNDIRAVKGVFLSARNFPAGGRNTPPMPTGRVGA